VSRLWQVPGSASALFVDGDAQFLHLEDQVPEAMLAGWRDQQLARDQSTIRNRDADVPAFNASPTNHPWAWVPQNVEEFSPEMRGDSRPGSTVDSGGLWTQVCQPTLRYPSVAPKLVGPGPPQAI
jgi:hypothetical protein